MGHGQRDVLEGALAPVQRRAADGDGVGHVAVVGAGVCRCRGARAGAQGRHLATARRRRWRQVEHRGQGFAPGIDVQRAAGHLHRHALGRQRLQGRGAAQTGLHEVDHAALQARGLGAGVAAQVHAQPGQGTGRHLGHLGVAEVHQHGIAVALVVFQAVGELERPGGLRRFVQWHGQRRGHPAQVGDHGDLGARRLAIGLLAARAHGHRHRRLAAQARRQAGDEGVFLGLAQRFGGDAALRTEAQQPLGIALAFDGHLLAPHLGARRHIEQALGEGDATAHRRHGRDGGAELERGAVLVLEVDLAFEAGLGAAVERDLQRKLHRATALALRLGQDAAQAAGQGRGGQVAQHVLQGALALATDFEQRVGVAQVVDAAFDVDQLELAAGHRAQAGAAPVDEQALPFEHQVAIERGERRPTQLGVVAAHEAGRGVVQGHVAQRHLHAEAAALVVLEGEFGELALGLEGGALGTPALDGQAHVLAGRRPDHQGQITPDARGLHPLEAAFEREHAGQACHRGRAGAPGRFQLAGHVGIGKTGLFDVHLPLRGLARLAARLHRPVHLGGQFVQVQAGHLEHTGQGQPAALDLQLGLATGLGGADADIGPRQARPPFGRRFGQAQALHAAGQLVGRGRARRAIPLPGQPLDHAVR